MRRALVAATAAAVLVAAISGVANPSLAATPSAGWLDPSFSGDGVVVVPSVTSGRNSVYLPDAHVTRVPDGRILVYTMRNPTDRSGLNGIGPSWLELTRFTAGGGIDPAWNARRPVIVLPGDPEVGAIQGPFVTPTGRVIVAFSSLTDTFVRAWTAAGHVDTGYGIGGGNSYVAFAWITVLPGGSLRGLTYSFGDPTTRLVGLTPGGLTDTRVGPDGSRPIAPIDTRYSGPIVSDALGRLTFLTIDVVGVDAADHYFVDRTSSSGVLAATWGMDGQAVVPLHPIDAFDVHLAVGPDESAYIATTTKVAGQARVTIAKLTPAGQPDLAFGTGGILVLGAAGSSRLVAMTLDGSGRPLLSYVAGSGATRQPTLARLLASDGSLDPAFGRGGRLATAGLVTDIAAVGAKDFVTVSRSGGLANATITLARRKG